MSLSVQQEALTSFDVLEDEYVVDLAREGDGEALEYLIHKYKHFVRAARSTD